MEGLSFANVQIPNFFRSILPDHFQVTSRSQARIFQLEIFLVVLFQVTPL